MTDELIFGAGLTAAEVEGVAHGAEWRRWIERDRGPDSKEGSGFRLSWRDDLRQLAGLGFSEIMVTLEWARLAPFAGQIDPEEIEFRRDLLGEIRSLGMEPWVCLVDGTLPGWFAEDEGGFSDDNARSLIWPRHVDWCGETFGDLVSGWVPVREPTQWAIWSHLLGVTPPGKARRRDAMQAIKGSLEAELHAWRLLRGTAPVATFQTARSIHAETDNVKAAPHAAWLDEAMNDLWLQSMSDGPGREAFDRVIVQLRPAIRVDHEGAWSAYAPDRVVETEVDALLRVIDSAGDRSVVAAGDLSDVANDGTARSDRLQDVVEQAQAAGASGWWQMSPIDGWHWLGGFDAKPGLIDIDRDERSVAQTLASLASRLG